MNNVKSTAWIEDGEKYAVMGLEVKYEGGSPPGKISPNIWVLADTAFKVPEHWQESLGSIRTKQIEACNLFLLSKLSSLTRDVLDGENQKLQERVQNCYVGLLLASPFAPAHKPVLLTGSRREEEIVVRQQSDFETPIPDLIRPYPPVGLEDVLLAAHLGEMLEAFLNARVRGGHWRFFQTLNIYIQTRTTQNILDRLHQYCRCIDGLILPDAGETRRQFKSRTELFIGPRHHELMGEIYDVRSAVEHLHENRYLEPFDRTIRLDLLQKEAIVGYIARTALARILNDDNLWSHFANASLLSEFWKLPSARRKEIWGESIDPMVAVSQFNPSYIHDGMLGGLNSG